MVKAITFTLREGVKFHNGKELTSADVKYTMDELIKANGYKAGAFYDTVPLDKNEAEKTVATPPANSPVTNANTNTAAKPAPTPKTKRVPHITSVQAPDAHTVIINIARPALRDPLFSSLVAIPIIPEGTIDQQKEHPVGSGPFRFESFDASQNIVELSANPDYWDGAPVIKKLRLKTVTDATSLQAELQTGGVDIAPNPSNLPPDMVKSLADSGSLNVEQFEGSNIQYVVFNTQSPPFNNVKVRQAIGYAINREKIVTDLLQGQATVANSILPASAWAYTPGTVYTYDPAKAKQLLAEAGYKGEPIAFKYAAGNAMINQYSQVSKAVSTMSDLISG